MQPSTTAPGWKATRHQWQRARDAMAGQDAVHQAGERYLPKLTGQTLEQYRAYLTRTPWYGATKRTVAGLVGMILRKPPQADLPPLLVPLAADMTLSVDMPDDTTRVAGITLHEVLSVGRVGWLIEYPNTGGAQMTEAEAQASNLRPYATRYATEAIVDWRFERRANAAQLGMVKLVETVTEWGAKYERVEVQQERWLLLDEEGRYVQRIYRDGMQQGPDIVPLMRGAPLRYIPFVGVCANGMGLDDCAPPLLDLIDLNLSHYRTSADLEHGAHFTGLPTPIIFGATLPEGSSLAIGSTNFIVLPSPDGDAKYLEFTGQGLGALEKLRDAKEAQMAAIGARMLAAEKKAAEAAETLAIRHSGETAVLAEVAHVVSRAIERVLSIMADWAGIAGDVRFQLSTDYAAAGLSAQELTALVQSWQAGAMSSQTLFDNLQRGELISEGVTFEEEQERIQSQGPVLTAPSSLG